MAKTPKAAVVEEPETEETDYSAYLAKPATALQEHLTDWIKEQTGITFASKAAEAAFDEGVKLTTQLRMHHQRSDENQERLRDLEAARLARESAPKEPKPEKAVKEAVPAKAPKAGKAPKVVEAAAEVRPAKRAAKKAARPSSEASTEMPF